MCRWLLLEMKREFPFDTALKALEVTWSSLPPATADTKVLSPVVLFYPVLWIRIHIESRFNGVPGSVSGSGFSIPIWIEEGKNDPQT
jgi:hypothetical protein